MAFDLNEIDKENSESEQEKKESLIHLGKPTDEEAEKYLKNLPIPIAKKGIGRPSIHRQKLDSCLEEILELILEGLTFRTLAIRYDVPQTCFWDWARLSDHSARITAALEQSADSYVDKAEQVLLDDQDDGNMAEIQRRKELSQFYRWKASKRSPKVFGDKQIVEHSGEVSQGLKDDQFAKLLETVNKKIEIKNNDDIEDAEIVQ